MKKMTSTDRILNQKALGSEPAEGSTVIKTELTRVYHIYNTLYDRKEAIEFLTEYLGEELVSSKDTSQMPNTIGWVARLLSRNVTLPEGTSEWFNSQFDSLPDALEVKAEKAITEDLWKENKVDLAIASLEEMLDKEKSPTEISSWIKQNQFNALTLKRIGLYYKPKLDELHAIAKNPDLKEAYSCFSKKEIRMMADRLNTIITIERPARKPRTKKAK